MSARIALLAALLAACHVPAARAVALSLSKPEQYFYWLPVETNRLTGIGMGTSAPSEDAPLRYEDAAFLTEAYAERGYALGVGSEGFTNRLSSRPVSTKIDTTFLLGEYQTVFEPGAQHPLARGYAKADATLLSGCARATNYEANEEDATASDRHVWLDIFRGTSDPFLSPSVDVSLLKRDAPLSSGTVCALYEDLGKLRRPCVRCVMTPLGGAYNLSGKEDSRYSTWAYNYFSDNGTWSYGTDNSTNEVKVNRGNYIFFSETSLKAGRKKSRGFNWDSEKREYYDATGVKNSHYTYTREWRTIGDVYADCSPAFAELGGRQFVSARAFGLGFYSMRRDFGSGGGFLKTEGYFVVDIPVLTSYEPKPQVLVVSIGRGDYNKAIINQVKELFGDPGYETGEDLLSAVIVPADPQKAHDGYKDTSNEYVLYRMIRIADFYVVFDMDFNARVKGGGE